MLDMIYAASSRCPCGERLGRWPEDDYWSCSAVLTGSARYPGQVGGCLHTERLPQDHWFLRAEYPSTETTAQFSQISA